MLSAPGFAPAKINLFLHVGPLGADGYHPVASLMTFADVGDVLTIHDAHEFGFSIDGPFAAGLTADRDNLVIRARDAVLSRADSPATPFHVNLTKNLPLASGIGGGSADAAALLRLLRPRFGLASQIEAEIAIDLGSDVAACLLARPMIGRGRGEILSPPLRMPDLTAVLANPGVASPTAEVYRAYDTAPHEDGGELAPLPPMSTPRDVAAVISSFRNDLEAPAIRLQPAIGETLDLLASDPDCLLARMSGSGATCFALTADAKGAAGLAERLAAQRPQWWIRATNLRGSR